MVRDFVKWDDLPISLPHFAESAVRAYKIAMTPPMMPVLIVSDSDLQERPVEKDARLHIPKLALAAPPQGDSGSVAEAARLLVAAENPVLIADRLARTPAGMAHLIELAGALQAPVIDQTNRMNFPTRHPLNRTERSREMIGNADLILGLELTDFCGTVDAFKDQLYRSSRSITKPGTKLVSISSEDLYAKGNYQDIQRYQELDLAMAADAEATLPSLIEAVKRLINDDRKRALQDRGSKFANAHQKALERARADAAYGWDASPITTARLCAELWAQIKNEDWSLVSDVGFMSRWPLRLWTFDKHYQYIGGAGGAGEGYGAPSAVGAALANRKYGRFSVSMQRDGDLMYGPGVLWTLAHHQVPLLSVMHNNRAYHQEVMHLQRMADRHERGITRAGIGTTIDSPNIDYAKLAQSMGVHGEGPVADPRELGGAIKRAVAVVKSGQPALADVVTEPR
jgi:thiamine pyrophosphate-dependent acetolactate synthase large subunit-like protein